MRLSERTGRPQTAKLPREQQSGELYSKHTNDLERKLQALNNLLQKNYDNSKASATNRYHQMDVEKPKSQGDGSSLPAKSQAASGLNEQKLSRLGLGRSQKSVRTSEFEASRPASSYTRASRVVKADHSVISNITPTPYNPKGAPLGPGGHAASYRYENTVALGRTDCRRQLGLDPAVPDDGQDAGSELYAGPSKEGARHRIRVVNPSWTMPKDTQQSMLAVYERRSRATPAPHDHHTDLDWNTIYGKFGAGSLRKTFCDDAMTHSRKVPSPSRYEPDTEQWGQFDEHDRFQKIKFVRLGKMEKCDGVDYLSNAEFQGLNTPGPQTYTPDASVIQKKYASKLALKMPLKGLPSGWRHEKTDIPGAGQYEKSAEASFLQSTKPKAPECHFSKMPLKRFTDLTIDAKRNIPGVGEHESAECHKKLSRPPSSLRRRR